MTQAQMMEVRKQTAAFAAKYIAPRADLQTGQEFPMDIWQEMGKAGLFQIGIAKTHGGAGGGYFELLKAGEAFVESGCNVGLAVSWLYQQIIARFILGAFATPAQRRQYLRPAAQGEITLSFAVSEPARGARPKLLTTAAQRSGRHFILNGEKTYLTNGPIADVFIVVAVTDDRTEQKRFTAFLVPRSAQGMTVLLPLAINFLKPSLHGGIKLEDSLIAEKSILGEEGKAWQDMVVPLGEIEDVVMMGPVLGGLSAELSLLVDAAGRDAAPADRTRKRRLGAFFALLETMRSIAHEAADRLDRGNASPAPLTITFARLAADFHAGFSEAAADWQIAPSAAYACLHRDLESMGSLKKGLLQVRQEKIGAALLRNV